MEQIHKQYLQNLLRFPQAKFPRQHKKFLQFQLSFKQ